MILFVYHKEMETVNDMQLNELIKKVMKEEKITQTKLAEMVGKKQGSISEALSNPNISGNNAVELLSAMGYKLVAVKETVVE